MPSLTKALDVKQGFDFKKDKSVPVGFISKMTVAGTALKADFGTIKDPLNPTGDIASVSVLNNFHWDTGPSDSVYLSGQISTANKQTLQTMLLNDLTNIEVKVEFTVYDYDPVAKKYFKCVFLNAELDGIIEKVGSDLSLSVSDDASSEVQSPKNYAFQLGLKPAPTEQTINVAAADQKNVVKKWGVTVAV